MKAVLLDTHAWAWSLTGDSRLSPGAVRAMTSAETVLISPISLSEIGQKVRLGKWPEMSSFVERLVEILEEQGGLLAPLEPRICLAASTLDWNHRDPFDRLSLQFTAGLHRCRLRRDCDKSLVTSRPNRQRPGV